MTNAHFIPWLMQRRFRPLAWFGSACWALLCANGAEPTAAPPPKRPPNSTAGKPPSVAANAEWPVANPAPGKPGYVLSPYNHKLILVRGIPSGAVVPDPATPDSDKKYFRVP